MSATLRTHLAGKAAHLPAMLDASLLMIAANGNPLRFSFAALGLRELLREFFKVVSPDSEVETASWHSVVDPKHPVTRRDRILFSVYGYVAPTFFPKSFSDDIDDLASDLIAKIDDLSKYLHVTPAVLTIPVSTLQIEFDDALDLFDQLIQAIASARSHVAEELTIRLGKALTAKFCEDFFDDLDCLSTHTRPQSADDVAVTINSIDSAQIIFSGSGSVSCDLQYGSDGDCRRGDGVEIADSYPFTFSGTAPVTTPLDVEVPKESIAIDTSSFYE